MTNHELIILALEHLRYGSYSPERRERCQVLIEEIQSGAMCVDDIAISCAYCGGAVGNDRST